MLVSARVIFCVAGVSSVLTRQHLVAPKRFRMGAGHQKGQAVMRSLWFTGTSVLPTLQEVGVLEMDS